MKVEAYRCDYCGHIKTYDEITGIDPTEDLFDKMLSFQICKPEKTGVHVCNGCHEKVVTSHTRLISRKKNEIEYLLKMKELTYLLRSSCVANVYKGKKFVI